MKNKEIAILIPCYNEAKTIEKVVKKYKKVLSEANIYVYDNNSTDRTDEQARNAGAIVRYEYRQGKGNVIRSMFRDIDADVYLMIDGDEIFKFQYLLSDYLISIKNYSVGEMSNLENIWTQNLDAEEWLDYSRQFDYLYLYTIDDGFLKKYGKYFEFESSDIVEHSLFSFDRVKNKYIMC